MIPYINIIQIILSILLISVILLQQRGGGLGSAFGGGDQTYGTRRGAEKYLFIGTIIIAILFVVTAIIRLVI